jgi:hypothetical protein
VSTQIEILYYDESVPRLPISGNTPFAYYDLDTQFQIDGPRFATFAARKLGYPIMEVEMQDINFYAALEDAVTVYSKELYEYKIRENYISLEGNPTGSAGNLNTGLIDPNVGNIIRMAQSYGSEVGSGGNINYYTGSLALKAGIQNYDLNAWASQSMVVQLGDEIEIKRIFFEAPPAIVRYFDPYAGTGTSLQSLMDMFGFGQMSPGINFMLMPIYFDVLKVQAIEFNDQIRRSAYTFELKNNKLRIFPIPPSDRTLFFEYIKKSERGSTVKDSRNNLITNVSNVPFSIVTYNQINGPAKKWVFDYAFSVAKETLGNIRGVYNSIPVPGSETTLNGQTLIDQANQEKTALIEQLRATFDDTSRQKQMEKKAAEANSLRDSLVDFPMPIYIR